MTGLPVSVIIAFHLPREDAARRQVESLKAQAGASLAITAVADGAETAALPWLRGLLPEADWIVHGEALGARMAFGRGLAAARARGGARRLYAFCDQDDVWHPEKLRRSAAHLAASGASLVHCDATVVDAAGGAIAGSLFAFERREHTASFLGALIHNSVSGFAALFTAETAGLAALLLARDGPFLHDHVTAAAAASLGRIGVLREPLAHYVQHDGNALGAKAHAPRGWRNAAVRGELARYRATSLKLFAERRLLANAFAAEGGLPPDLARLFHPPAASPARWGAAALRLRLAGEPQRARLALRLMDGARAYAREALHKPVKDVL